jgi:cobalamin biosynthetic protein CobC
MEPKPEQIARDHGGNLDAAIAAHGGTLADWIDLSTGINPVPYPVPAIDADVWAALPRAHDMARLLQAAQSAYGTPAPICALAGAQGAIQAIPFLHPPGQARVLAPTYNEHAAALRTGGWQVEEVTGLEDLTGAHLAILVNPNNPTGAAQDPDRLFGIARKTGLLVVDESFADPTPALSLAPRLGEADNILLLRSFGKFYGLAGLRLGFAIGPERTVARLRELAGPWPVSGPALQVATAALRDTDWQTETTARLARDAARLDGITERAGLHLVGGTALFRTYHAMSAAALQDHLARHCIWSRIFPYSRHWIRLGLPGTADHWTRLEAALAAPLR